MSFSLADVAFFASDAGVHLLERLACENLSDANTLPLLTSLRRDYTGEQAGPALALARLRAKAADKFGTDAARMFFTREALEQSSDPRIRQWRAGRIARPGRLIDACCGVGSDALAFAAAGCDVLGLDLDPVRVEMARLNAAALNLQARFEVADVREDVRLFAPDVRHIFYDPARRDDDGRRIHHVEQYEPPLSLIRGWLEARAQSGLIAEAKLSPGVDLEQLAGYGGTLTFLSVSGDLKEALLSTRRELQPGLVREAMLLTQDAVYHWEGGADQPEAPLSEPRAWLLEPDPALIRAGLVQAAAVRFGGARLDETIAYLTADAKPNMPWVRAWQILDWMPFNVKKLRGYLRERNVGQVTVKKRGTAVTPEILVPQLKLKGDASRTIVLTRCGGAQIAIICADYVP